MTMITEGVSEMTLYRVRFDLITDVVNDPTLMAANSNHVNILAPNIDAALVIARRAAPTLRYGAVHKNLHVADIRVIARNVLVDVEVVKFDERLAAARA